MTGTLVVGLGNPILCDDGVGIYASRLVRTTLPPESGVDVIEVSVGGLALMEVMIGYQRVVLIDALLSPDAKIGQVAVFPVGDLPPTLNTSSSHDTNLRTALALGRRLGASLPADSAIQIVGVGVSDVLTFSERPTLLVAAAIRPAAQAVLSLLGFPALRAVA